ncbi:MAG: lytic transglycosylase domain-containing protein [Pseudomonadota bacterium]|nr:lytic transglycosylase domain-containing protein [Pseudomonadota bacterium]
MAAHEAYRNRDLGALQKLAERPLSGPLADYVQFWWIEARLGTALRQVAPGEVHQFLARNDGPLSERLRADWLKALAQQQSWVDLLADAGGYAGSDPEVVCGLASAHLRGGDSDIPDNVRALWVSGRSTPPGCEPVFARLLASGHVQAEDLLVRFQHALQIDNTGVAKALAPLLPPELAVADAAFAQAIADPAGWLARFETHPRNRAMRVLELHALGQVARSDPPQARALWEHAATQLTPVERAQGWARIAVRAAQKLDPDALADFRRAHDASFLEAELPWWVRAALRAGAWDEVLHATEQMSEVQAAQPVWRYWRARALKTAGRRDEALEAFAQVGHPNDYYGQLAAEELGQRVLLSGSLHAEPDEQAQVRARPGIQRALALFHLGLQSEAAQEWGFALRGASDRLWLAAADVAHDAEWYDRMISAAEHAGPDADPGLRYPLPFREALHARARENGLDEAWVYGLVRQESRFLPEAQSRSGALGLMQLMPATARWAARKIGLRDFKPAYSQEVQTNLQLGSYYLHHVLEDLGHPVLATAGYNAGPNRVRRWLEARSLEGAVFIETIPVTETRDYVQKVMANATLYAQRLGLPGRALKSRLGSIKGLAGLPAVDEGDGGFDIPLPVVQPQPLATAQSAPVPTRASAPLAAVVPPLRVTAPPARPAADAEAPGEFAPVAP